MTTSIPGPVIQYHPLAELPSPSIVIYKPARTPYLIDCDGCRFTFERTAVAVARSWAAEHNTKNHDGQLPIIDRTLPQTDPTD